MFSISLADPLLAAGLVDFMVVSGLILVWMLAALAGRAPLGCAHLA